MKVNGFGRFGLSREACWSSFVVSWWSLGPSIGRPGPFLGPGEAIWTSWGALRGLQKLPRASWSVLGLSYGASRAAFEQCRGFRRSCSGALGGPLGLSSGRLEGLSGRRGALEARKREEKLESPKTS